ncbi:MAG: right-handed parallel beta-helix repeat-containing protein [Candidatus Eisenbacteria sp.]|nr:right-handed parallel beta-helix repeat-containing protein [Candidatus Eisenbacteria bacterium]
MLRGITVTGGYATGYGGALYLDGDSYYYQVAVSVENCIFHHNSARAGGGVFCGGHVYSTFTDCIFEANQTRVRGSGGGMGCASSFPTIVRCAFIGNLTTGLSWGGLGDPTIDQCSFSGHSGYGLSCNTGTPEITRCSFFDNGDSGIQTGYCAPTIEACAFWNNQSTFGAAINFAPEVSALVTDCIFYRNVAGESGGAISCDTDGTVTILSSTMAYNEAGTGAAGLDCGSAEVTVDRSIIAHGVAGTAVVGLATLSCCDLFGNAGGDWIGDIAGQYGVDGNISEDPIFCDPWSDDFTLQSDSPCAPFSPPDPECDLIGSEPIGCQPPTAVLPPAEAASWGGVKALFRSQTH